MLTADQLDEYRDRGHLTVPDVFDPPTIALAIDDVAAWSLEFLDLICDAQKRWYLENAVTDDSGGTVLRKLDEPVFHRAVFREMAHSKRLVAIVEQIIGSGVSVFFSQVFCKPPEVGGPKPVHQDNYYFGPDDSEATLTVWIALDEATVDNGCLFYADGSHRGPIHTHTAPPDEPFNLQIPADQIDRYPMTPAPVPAGGISLHHGNTWHQSSANTSAHPRRAVAMHYIRNDASLIKSALEFNPASIVKIT